MSSFHYISQTIWCCQYHIVLGQKYRFRILNGEVVHEVERCIRAFIEHQKAVLVELSIQIDHVHSLVFVPHKISISNFVGVFKERTAIRAFNRFRKFKYKQYYGNHFLVTRILYITVGFDEDVVRNYVKYQMQEEQK